MPSGCQREEGYRAAGLGRTERPRRDGDGILTPPTMEACVERLSRETEKPIEQNDAATDFSESTPKPEAKRYSGGCEIASRV